MQGEGTGVLIKNLAYMGRQNVATPTDWGHGDRGRKSCVATVFCVSGSYEHAVYGVLAGLGFEAFKQGAHTVCFKRNP